jgi:hypothetical protein
MEVKKTLVTPAIAESILQSNTSNRPPKPETITRYAKEMAEGRWKESTGELIKISKSGKLIDGQHRLISLVRANVSLHFHIAYNLEDSIFDVIDSGSMRTAKDSLFISGVPNATKMAALIVSYNRISKGRFYTENGSVKLTNNQVIELYNQRPVFWETTLKKALVWQNKFSTILPYSIIGGFYACFCERSESKAYEFFEQLCDLQSTEFPAIVSLKKKLVDAKIIKTQKLTMQFRYALIIKAWNRFRANDKSVRLTFDPETEKHPEII